MRDDFYSTLQLTSKWTVIGSCDLTYGVEQRSLHGKRNGFFGGQLVLALKGEGYKKGQEFINVKDTWSYLKTEMDELSKQVAVIQFEWQTPVLYGDVSSNSILGLVPSM